MTTLGRVFTPYSGFMKSGGAIFTSSGRREKALLALFASSSEIWVGEIPRMPAIRDLKVFDERFLLMVTWTTNSAGA